MKRLAVILSLGAICAGCAAAEWFGAKPEARSAAAQMVARADELLQQGQPGAARDLYAQVAAEPARDALHARALFDLARLYVDPSSGLRDYRAARLAFDRLLWAYPKGEWELDAWAWRTALAELAAREAELGAREAEVARLKSEAAKLGADLQRLKRIDLNLERRR